MPNIIPNTKYCSVKEYAQQVSMTPQAIYNAIKTGRLKYYNINGMYIIPRNALILGRRNRSGETTGISELKKGNLTGFLAKRGYRIK